MTPLAGEIIYCAGWLIAGLALAMLVCELYEMIRRKK
jgi:hypothetical protein